MKCYCGGTLEFEGSLGTDKYQREWYRCRKCHREYTRLHDGGVKDPDGC